MAKQKKKKVVSRPAPFFSRIFPYLIFAFGIILYTNTFSHDYAFDDSIVITGNQFTQKGFAGISDLLTKDFFEGIYGQKLDLTGGRYRPLSQVTFAIEWGIFGENPAVSHFVNALLYGLCCLLLFNVLSFLTGSKSSLPYLTSLIFCFHPLHTEVVANIKSRDEILCLIFLLLCLEVFSKLKSLFETKRVVLASLYFFLALLSKETAITYILCIPAILFVFSKESVVISLKKGIPLLAVFIIYLILRTSITGVSGGQEMTDIMENPFALSGFSEKFGTIGVILLYYLKLVFIPYPLVCDYAIASIPFVELLNIKSILGWLIYLAMGIYFVRFILKKNIYALSILLFVSPVILTSNIFFNIGAPMAERFLFLPSIGFSLALAHTIFKYGKFTKISQFRVSNFVVLGTLILLAMYSFLVYSRNPDWQNNLTLFEKDVKSFPENAKLNFYYSNALIQEFNDHPNPALLDIALSKLVKAREINPEFHWVHYNLGLVYEKQGKSQLALESLNTTLAKKPNHILSHVMLGKLYGSQLNRIDLARNHLEKVVEEFKYEDPSAFQYLGNVYGMEGRHNEAIKMYEKALSLEPDNVSTIQNLATAYSMIGDQSKADFYTNKARQIGH